MEYQELHQRYGSHIAKRVQGELDVPEFNNVEIEDLASYLGTRAVAAYKKYQQQLDDPFRKRGAVDKDIIDLLHHHWRNAEEIAYLVTVAEEVRVSTSKHLAAG